MIAYAESSAVLAWLLGEPEGSAVRGLLGASEKVVASTLTPLECTRVLARGAAAGRLAEADELIAHRLLDDAARSWALLEMTGEVLRRAAGRFPAEPVRTLDAIHLATAQLFHERVGDLTVVSLDERVRANAQALGVRVGP